jgi:hypothetical protein
MATLALKMSVSLDESVAPADGSCGWEAACRSFQGAEWVLDTVSAARAALVGAATYTRWAGFWPDRVGIAALRCWLSWLLWRVHRMPSAPS